MSNPNPRPICVLGTIDGRLDVEGSPSRGWRPSVGLAASLRPARFDLLAEPALRARTEAVAALIRAASPETEVRILDLRDHNPFKILHAYSALAEFFRSYDFDPARFDYAVHLSAGASQHRIALQMLVEASLVPGRIVESEPPPRGALDAFGTYDFVDLRQANADELASRFRTALDRNIAILSGGIETRNPAFRALISSILRVALWSRQPILLGGPSGSGKSEMAGRVFQAKQAEQNVAGELVTVNCATLRGHSPYAALFGYARGSFTGAVREHTGYLARADGGVLFLDEVTELGLEEQAMLLTALESKRFLPLGAEREVTSKFQLICGSNADLIAAVRQGRFREDLFARISQFTFRLPGLRDRLEDLEPNLEHERLRVSAELDRPVTFNEEALARYLAFATSPDAAWLGNFRDLAGSMSRMAIQGGGRITPEVARQEEAELRWRWGTGEARPLDAGSSVLSTPLARRRLGERASGFCAADLVELEALLEAAAGSRQLTEIGRRLYATNGSAPAANAARLRVMRTLERFGLTKDDLG